MHPSGCLWVVILTVDKRDHFILFSVMVRHCHTSTIVFASVMTCLFSSVIHSLLDICSVISNLDIALHANTWKFIIK